MKTKLDQVIPDDLASALRQSQTMIEMWDGLRPSCQRRYVNLVIEAKRLEARKRRIERVLEMTGDYYRRHYGKS